MSKKIKKRLVEQELLVNEELEDVSEDESFMIEFDEKQNEVLLVFHYRKAWGDRFDDDVEHALNMEENNDLIASLLVYLTKQQEKVGIIKPLSIESIEEIKKIDEEMDKVEEVKLKEEMN